MPLQREACPEYDVEVLYDALLTHARTEGAKGAFAFGGYDAIQASHAVHGAALLGNSGVLEAVLTATPRGMVRYTDLKMCIKNQEHRLPDAGAAAQSYSVAVRLAGRLGGSDGRTADGVLAHLRRLHQSSVRLTQAQSKMSLQDKQSLQQLI